LLPPFSFIARPIAAMPSLFEARSFPECTLMKILIANTLYYPDMVGGAEVSTQILAEGLAASGAEVVVVCATGTGRDRVGMHNGVKVVYLRFANLYWPHSPKKHSRVARLVWHAIDVHNVVMARKLKKLIAEEKPDIISTSNLSCLSIGIWRIANDAGVPIVHTARDYYLMCPTSKMLSQNKSCTKQCSLCSQYAGPKKRESSRVDIAIGVSRFVLQKHIDNGFFPNAASTGVISDCYLPMSEPMSLPKKIARSDESVHLGVLGRVSPEKGIEILLDELMRDTTFDWRVSIGGTGDAAYLAALRERYDDPRINFLGHVKANQFLQEIDILVVPSKWNEPFGRVTVEAYSHGLPVVGANTGGIPEVIEPNTHLVFDIERPASVIEKIREAIELLKSSKARERMLDYAETFSPGAMVDAYLNVYENALRKEEQV
jgi:glycosyltransferase involved in cell wall biosynthesis